MKNKRYYTICFILLLTIAIVGRLLPHLPDMTPLTAVSIFATRQLPRKLAMILIAISLLVTDYFLSVLKGYPLWGSWTFFTYSGFLIIGWIGNQYFKKKRSHDPYHFALFSFTAIASIGFWLWSNLGVYLTSHLYPQNLQGLSDCYLAALPFLGLSLIGDLSWTLIINGLLSKINLTYKTRLLF